MDEPCSALDPISTIKVEDLMNELKKQYTIVIVTHNMQQASRVSDRTAFFNAIATEKGGKMGYLVEYDKNRKYLWQSQRRIHPRLCLWAIWLNPYLSHVSKL